MMTICDQLGEPIGTREFRREPVSRVADRARGGAGADAALTWLPPRRCLWRRGRGEVQRICDPLLP